MASTRQMNEIVKTQRKQWARTCATNRVELVEQQLHELHQQRALAVRRVREPAQIGKITREAGQ